MKIHLFENGLCLSIFILQDIFKRLQSPISERYNIYLGTFTKICNVSYIYLCKTLMTTNSKILVLLANSALSNFLAVNRIMSMRRVEGFLITLLLKFFLRQYYLGFPNIRMYNHFDRYNIREYTIYAPFIKRYIITFLIHLRFTSTEHT